MERTFMLLSLLLYTVIIPLLLGIAVALIGPAPGAKPGISALLLALGGAVALWLLDGIPALPPASAKHKVLLLAALLVPLAPALLSWLHGATARALAFLAFGLAALAWIGGARVTDPALLPRIGVVLAFLLLVALGLSRVGRTRQSPFAAPSALLATQLATAILALLAAFIGGGQLAGALAALTGGMLLIAYLALVRGADRPALPESALWTGFALTVPVLIQSSLFAPSITPFAVVLAALPLPLATFAPGPFSRNRLLAPILSGALAILPALAAIGLAAI